MTSDCEKIACAFERLAIRAIDNYRHAVVGQRGATEALADLAMLAESLEGELDIDPCGCGGDPPAPAVAVKPPRG